MDLAIVIQHLKTHCPMLGTRVAGAAEYEKALTKDFMVAPCAYVIPMADDAEPNEDANGLFQTVTESVSIMLILDNAADRRGQAPLLGVDTAKAAIHKAMLNWRIDPDRAPRGLQYEGGNLVDMNGAKLSWQMTYSQEVQLTELDGFIPPSVALLNISARYDGTDIGISEDLPQ